VRLCYVANPTSIHTQRWIRAFAAQGHELTLIGVSPTRKALAPGALPAGIRLIDLGARFDVRGVRYALWGLMARRIVRSLQFDLVHAHQVAGPGWVAAATGMHPLVVTAWGSDLLVGPQRSRVQRWLARWVLHSADRVTCVSQELAEAARALGAPPERVRVTYWGVDTDLFRPAPPKPELRQALHLGSGPIVLNLRALWSIYNPLTFAEAIGLVRAQVPEAQFVVRTHVHDARLLAEFQAAVQRQGAESAVTAVGALPDEQAIADLYRLADVAVSIPSSDGTPVSVLEAMACGIPVIATELPSLREWITDGENGYLVPVRDAPALAAAVIRLLREPERRETFGQRSLERIRARGDRRRALQEAEALYHELLSGGQ